MPIFSVGFIIHAGFWPVDLSIVQERMDSGHRIDQQYHHSILSYVYVNTPTDLYDRWHHRCAPYFLSHLRRWSVLKDLPSGVYMPLRIEEDTGKSVPSWMSCKLNSVGLSSEFKPATCSICSIMGPGVTTRWEMSLGRIPILWMSIVLAICLWGLSSWAGARARNFISVLGL